VFWLLHDGFAAARKPLTFISEHYLRYKRQSMFGLQDS
jgi:hypothetical protein